MTCPKCGHQGKPSSSYMDAHRTYGACDLNWPECIRLFCSQCGHEEWMHTADYRPPTREQVEYSKKFWDRPWWKVMFNIDEPQKPGK